MRQFLAKSGRRRFLTACVAGGMALGTDPIARFASRLSAAELAVATSTDQIHGPLESITIRDAQGIPVVVTAMDVAPEGRFIALACEDDTIQILDGQTFHKQTVLRGHRDRNRSISIDYQGQKMASVGNDGRLILWSADSGNFEKLRSLGNTPALARVQFSPDASRIAAVGFTPKVFMIGSDGKSADQWKCSHTDLRTVAFREDGKSIVVAGQGGTVHGHDAGGKDTFTRKLHRGPINGMRFMPSTANLVTIGDDGNVIQIDTRNDEITHRVGIGRGKLFSIAVIGSDMVAVAGSDDDIRIVDFKQGAVVQILRGHRGSVVSLAMSGGDLISAGYDATLRRWKIDGPTSQRVATTDGLER